MKQNKCRHCLDDFWMLRAMQTNLIPLIGITCIWRKSVEWLLAGLQLLCTNKQELMILQTPHDLLSSPINYDLHTTRHNTYLCSLSVELYNVQSLWEVSLFMPNNLIGDQAAHLLWPKNQPLEQNNFSEMDKQWFVLEEHTHTEQSSV